MVKKKTHGEFVDEVWDKHGDIYNFLSEYINGASEIKVKHKIYGFEWTPIASNLLRGSSKCPRCSGKRKMTAEEFTFGDCRYRSLLFFDFAIFDTSGSLVRLIEFDGKQHFEPIDFFGGEEGFRLTQLRDSIKNEYCDANGIPLLRISYWNEDNLKSILESYLSSILNISCKEGA